MKYDFLKCQIGCSLVVLTVLSGSVIAQDPVPKAEEKPAIKLTPRQKPEDFKPSPLVAIPDNPPPHEGGTLRPAPHN